MTFATFTPRKYLGIVGGDIKFPPEFHDEIISRNIKSVIDVGCGTGWAAKEFLKLGVQQYVGVDERKQDGIVGLATFTHPNIKWIYGTRIQDFKSEQIFDAAFVKCIFCSISAASEVNMIIAILKTLARFLLIYDTPHSPASLEWTAEDSADYSSKFELKPDTKEALWPKKLEDAGFELEVHAIRPPSVVQVWRNKNIS